MNLVEFKNLMWPLGGIRFNIMDVTLDTDAIHRGAGQIMPATRRCCCLTKRDPGYLLYIGDETQTS